MVSKLVVIIQLFWKKNVKHNLPNSLIVNLVCVQLIYILIWYAGTRTLFDVIFILDITIIIYSYSKLIFYVIHTIVYEIVALSNFQRHADRTLFTIQ